MNEAPYSNREFREFISEIREQLVRIEAQTTKTNGRVTYLEHKNSYVNGALKIIGVVVIPIFAFLAYQVFHNSIIIRNLVG